MMIQMLRCNSGNPDFKTLVYQLDDDLNNRYGLIQKEYDAYNKLEFIETAIIAYDLEEPVGCGCFREHSASVVEIKRMFVLPQYRGKGIAGKILNELENWAKDKKFEKAILETGAKQNEAIGLYKKMGYRIVENYGQYIGNKNSVCMEKLLT